MNKAIPALVSAALVTPLSSSPVKAQEHLALEEILVTASRRVESLQEVAMSVSAFSTDFLQNTGVNGLAALEEYTPNLKITPGGTDSNATSIRIRGIGSMGTNAGIDPSVGVFIDGIYQGRAGMSIGDLVDIERVEVLRGPQGTLYGKNTAAGAISVISKQPGGEFEAFAEVTYDSNDKGELRGMLNLPLGDSPHALRMSAFAANGDHLYKNTFTGRGTNDVNKYGGRARVLFDLEGDSSTEGFGQFILTLDYTKEDTDCCALATIGYEGLSTLNSPTTAIPTAQLQQELGMNAAGRYILQYKTLEDGAGFSPPAADSFDDDYWFDAPVYNKVDIGGAALEWNRDLANDSTITFINAWRFYQSDSAYDGDFTAYDAVIGTTDIDLDQFSSELRITSGGGETFDYQGGLYAYVSDMDSVGTFEQGELLVDSIFVIPNTDLTMGVFFPDGTLNTDTNNYKTTSYAAFGQVVWNMTEALSATLGLRYTYERKERSGSQITDPESFLDIPPVAGPDTHYDNSRSDSAVSPSLNVRYFFNPDVMGYASVSRGFKSGGFDQRRLVQGEAGEFDEEIATSYELGWKTTFANRRLRFNGTLFLVNYDDFQSQSFDGASVRVTNAGDLQSYGSELELIFLPVSNMTLGSAIGYNKAEYDSFDNGQCTVTQAFQQYYVIEGAQSGSPSTSAVCTQDLAGHRLDNAPEWNISSFLQYYRDVGSTLAATARLEHSYIDEFYLDQDLDEHLKNDAVNLVNLRLSLSNLSRDWEVSVWGRNLLDEEYYSWGLDTPTIGGYTGAVAPGAYYGVTLRYFH
ncbi:TonB-dependent receptor [Seongchinamella unica]|uniref:TonB-dependent receptor n=1 Tax=Seongchinamella unica TaxID=2547392 RepID=A0A4R5LU02_9GAMM|nr:TonB-dependent receptor [Seongchinamella unica]TDG14866.1 TonB-dependent receptor [Seongchinamella unica]